MKKKIIKLTEKRIAKLCKEAYAVSRSRRSYSVKSIDVKNIELFLLFLDFSFEKPYNRLNALAHFINESGRMMVDQMYPIGFMTKKAKKVILDKSEQASKLGRGLDASGLDPSFTILWKEKSLENEQT